MIRRLGSLPLTASLALAFSAFAGSFGLAQDSGSTNAIGPETPPPAPPTPPGDLSQAPPDEPAPPASPQALSPEVAAPATDTSNGQDNEAAAEPAPPPPPPTRPRYTTAVIQALDKVTAETLRFEARINEPVRYKDLVITVNACETNATDEATTESIGHLDVQYQPDVLPGRAPQAVRQVFRGWMYAKAPGLNPFQHPIYDLWMIACKTPVPAPAAPATPTPSTGASL